jgi:hypothetical protein
LLLPSYAALPTDADKGRIDVCRFVRDSGGDQVIIIIVMSIVTIIIIIITRFQSEDQVCISTTLRDHSNDN